MAGNFTTQKILNREKIKCEGREVREVFFAFFAPSHSKSSFTLLPLCELHQFDHTIHRYSILLPNYEGHPGIIDPGAHQPVE